MLNVHTLNKVMLNVVMLKLLMLNVDMLNKVMLNVVMLNGFLLSAVMLNVAMLNVVMQNAVMLNVVMLNVVAPCKHFGKDEKALNLNLGPLLQIIFTAVKAGLHISYEWEAINRKQITRWQHVSQLKASSFGSW